MNGAAALHLSFEYDPVRGTILRVKAQEPPWRVVRGFSTPSGELLAHIHNLSGGVLDTDVLFSRFDLGPHAQAQLTTTGATRIYRSRSAARSAMQHTEVHLGEGAYLEYLPDQVIPFAGSRFGQTTRIRLERNASFIWWEQVAPGREASGESFRYQSLASDFRIETAAQPVFIERWTLAPLLRRVDSAARLGSFRHFGSGYICCTGEPAPDWRKIESELQDIAGQSGSPDVLWGVSCLPSSGIVIRGLSTSGRILRDSWVEIWKAAKWLLCGRRAAPPRKVP